MKVFADYPFRLYKNCPHYVPSFRADEEGIADPKRNPYLEDADIRCFLAYKDGALAGRIAGIVQRKYNKVSGRKCIRFSRFDCIDDEKVAAALFAAVEAYGREEGLDTIHGPWGFNDQDREGLLTYGFDRRATYCTNYNYPYYEKLVRSYGFTDETEWLEYDFVIPEKTDERIARIAERLKDKFSVRDVVGSMPLSKLIKAYGHKTLALVNEAYASLDGYVAVEGKAVDKILDQFATVLNPRYFSILVNEKDEVVGMAVMLPSLCEAIRKSDGRLVPLRLYPRFAGDPPPERAGDGAHRRAARLSEDGHQLPHDLAHHAKPDRRQDPKGGIQPRARVQHGGAVAVEHDGKEGRQKAQMLHKAHCRGARRRRGGSRGRGGEKLNACRRPARDASKIMRGAAAVGNGAIFRGSFCGAGAAPAPRRAFAVFCGGAFFYAKTH